MGTDDVALQHGAGLQPKPDEQHAVGRPMALVKAAKFGRTA